MELMWKRISEDLPLDDLTCSPELRQVIGRLTARDVNARYRDAAEAKAALDATPEAAETAAVDVPAQV
jgi:hypothetical protein